MNEVLEQVSKEVGRAARIVTHLREFVRGCEPRRADIRVEHVLEQAIDLLRPVARDRGFQLDLWTSS